MGGREATTDLSERVESGDKTVGKLMILCPPVLRAGVHCLHRVVSRGKWWVCEGCSVNVVVELTAVSGLLKPQRRREGKQAKSGKHEV